MKRRAKRNGQENAGMVKEGGVKHPFVSEFMSSCIKSSEHRLYWEGVLHCIQGEVELKEHISGLYLSLWQHKIDKRMEVIAERQMILTFFYNSFRKTKRESFFNVP